MEIDQLSWNDFVVRNSSPASFLQSWQWGEFQGALGNKVYRFDIKDQLLAQVVVKKLPLNRSYLEIPKGPVFVESAASSKLLSLFVEKLKEVGKTERTVLARINPPYSSFSPSPGDGEGLRERSFEELGFRKPELLLRQMEPARTILIDLNKSEDELLLNMHEKARYNIRLAQRKGVKVRVATQDTQAFEKFLVLLEETTKRDKIVSWPRERFMKFREAFMSSGSPSPGDGEGLRERSVAPHAELLVGEYQGEILAAAIIMFFGDSATYLYAASSAQERSANAPSLVLWEAIKLARARGEKWYDMWGVAPPNEPGHPWAGITRFKTRYVTAGVTGKEIVGVGAQDLILDKTFYTLSKLYKLLGLR